jgi:Ca2+-transporting ATPase
VSEKECVWHAIEAKEALQRLGSSVAEGLKSAEARERLERYGPNALQEEEGLRIPKLILAQFRDYFVIMLLAAAGLSALLQEYTDAVMIAIIVLLAAVVGFIQEYRSERAMEAMRKLTAPTAKVIRDGYEKVVPAKEVVPGDIVVLEEGDRVPADALLVEVHRLKTNEAPLTGESTPVEKDLCVVSESASIGDRKNSVYMGTHVVYGHGRAIVTNTGMNTEFGKIAGAVQELGEEKTPLKSKLDVLGKRLGGLIIALVILIFIFEIMRDGLVLDLLLEDFMSAIALAVSAVPEALPALVTVTLAIGARNLAKNNALVRRLASAETLGATTVICADKTGTLTKGEMTVRQLYVDGREIEVTGAGYEAKGSFQLGDGSPADPDDADLELLLRAGALCNNAQYDGEGILGDPTEGALIVAAAKAGISMESLQGLYPRREEVPFSSERKRMTTVHSFSGEAGRLVAYVKGAPETVLDLCTHIRQDGGTSDLTEAKKQEILEVNARMASQALRVLGFAYRELPAETQPFTEEKLERELVFIGLQGMIDPPREEVVEALTRCRRAGIKNVMITGDHKLTAVAIAREIGMLEGSGEGLALTGAELDRLSDEEYEGMVERVRVYARVSPMHKLKIVGAWKNKGEIVAMTGDGVNDAPALKKADIGVAMGITGTDVSKEASDMVLADDNYATLVRAVEGGRAIYDNIRKYIRFLIACNFDELLVIGGWSLLGFPLPMLPIQVLWINLVTDGPPAIALSVDPPEKGIMERKPRDPRAGIFDGMMGFITLSFIAQALGSSICFAYGYFIDNSYEKAVTMTFLQAALFELLVIWNCRSETRSFWRLGRRNFENRFFAIGTIASIALTLALPYIPGLSDAFGVVPLTGSEWGIVFLTASSGLWLVIPEWFNRRNRVAQPA